MMVDELNLRRFSEHTHSSCSKNKHFLLWTETPNEMSRFNLFAGFIDGAPEDRTADAGTIRENSQMKPRQQRWEWFLNRLLHKIKPIKQRYKRIIYTSRSICVTKPHILSTSGLLKL